MRYLAPVLAVGALALHLPALAEPETLQNDGFISGGAASFQAGFVTGEMAAARFVPNIACPCVVESVTVLFGGNAETELMGIEVWNDPGGSPIPGDQVFSGEVNLVGSNIAFNEIDLSVAPVIVNGPFRVGLRFNHSGLPAIATDLDGSIDSAANFILADLGGVFFWFSSSTLGVSGDFILRANIDNFAVPDADEDTVPDDLDNCIDVPNSDQLDSDGDLYGNACDTDLNNDCVSNAVDLGLLRVAFFASDGDPNWNPAADFNGDGTVNVVDLGTLRATFFGAPGPSGLTAECDADR